MARAKSRNLIKDSQLTYSIRFGIYGIRPVQIQIANFVIGLRKGLVGFKLSLEH